MRQVPSICFIFSSKVLLFSGVKTSTFYTQNNRIEALLGIGYTEQTRKAKHSSKDPCLTLWYMILIFKDPNFLFIYFLICLHLDK